MTKRSFYPKQSLVAAAVLSALLALSACHKDVIQPEGGGAGEPRANTYITVSLNIGTMSAAPRAALRAEDTEHHNAHTKEPEWKGRDRIDKVILYLFDDENSPATVKTFAGAEVPEIDATGKMTLKPWKTTIGSKTIYAIINPSAEIEAALTQANTGLQAFDTAYRADYDFLVSDKAEFQSFWDGEANAKFRTAFNNSSISDSGQDIESYLFRHGMVKPSIAFTYPKLDREGSAISDEATGEMFFEDVILMTGEPVTKNILPNVTEAMASAGQNTLSLVLRRAVAQAVVTLNGVKFYNAEEGTGYSDRNQSLAIGSDGTMLHHLRWTVQQYEAKSYLSAQGTTATDTRSPKYDFISKDPQSYDSGYYHLPSDVTATEVDKWYDVPAYSPYIDGETGLYKSYTKESLAEELATPSLYAAWSDAKNSPTFYTSPRFITETTHAYNEASYRKGNTAYYVVAGILVPGESRMGKAQTVTDPDYSEKGTTLYYGIADGLYYTDYATAYRANNAGAEPTTTPTDGKAAAKLQDNLITYVDGFCYYIAWVNPDTSDAKSWKMSPVVRNNFYHMNINGFSRPGYSGIPLLPGGDHPLTPDPDDPVPGPDEPLKDSETHMAATVTVRGWGVHAYEITF